MGYYLYWFISIILIWVLLVKLFAVVFFILIIRVLVLCILHTHYQFMNSIDKFFHRELTSSWDIEYFKDLLHLVLIIVDIWEIITEVNKFGETKFPIFIFIYYLDPLGCNILDLLHYIVSIPKVIVHQRINQVSLLSFFFFFSKNESLIFILVCFCFMLFKLFDVFLNFW